ncbi:hypothetical protein [Rhodoferax saidenbachensis]|uniref:hypothetical protein n=1 Tax=Rhodoferax saidenbachensis TaxID=1484693 RepID=UPI0004AECF52|nr:hypothetical protein [Rhodoferax saidenbachensis]
MTYTAAELSRIHDLARLQAQAARREAIDLFWARAWDRLKALLPATRQLEA